mmetsp:Transcript_31550/g.44058  ORF Transcript_31550/g.44058 Transcript_31550/m.44058 type:complete len:424 (+) Transcript_31550:256-1527(+)
MAAVARSINIPTKSTLTSPKAFAVSRGRSRSVGSANSVPSGTPPKHATPRGRPSAAAFTTKKGKAGGGKGSWGRFNDDIVAAKTSLQSQKKKVTTEDEDQGVVLVETTWTITPAEIRSFLEPKLLQYLCSTDASEIVAPISELGRPDLNAHLVEFLVIEGIERNDLERELISELLAELDAKRVFTMADIEAGFDLVLPQLVDLNLDTPNAHQVAGKFMARAVADEIMPPRFVTSRPGPQDSDEAALAFAKARGLITTPQGLSRLAHVWGSNGARSPVDELRSKVSLMLGELVLTGDTAEAEACTRDLHAKHFMHEVVFQAIELSIDGRSERDMLLLAAFLKGLCNSAIIPQGQLDNGLARITDSIDDIQLDNPHAALNLDTFCRIASSFLPREFCVTAAQRARRAINKSKGGRVRSITAPIST